MHMNYNAICMVKLRCGGRPFCYLSSADMIFLNHIQIKVDNNENTTGECRAREDNWHNQALIPIPPRKTNGNWDLISLYKPEMGIDTANVTANVCMIE